MVSWRAVGVGLVAELLALVFFVSFAAVTGLSPFYDPFSPSRLAPVCGGVAAGWWALRRHEEAGPKSRPRPRLDPVRTATEHGVALAGVVVTGALVGILLQSGRWFLVTLVCLVLAGVAWRSDRDDRRRLTATAVFLAVVTLMPRLRVGFGFALVVASLWPHMGAYTFLVPRPGTAGWTLLGLALVGYVVGAALAGVWAKRRDGKGLSQ
ncbi:hypothetical protein [Haloarchaeobius sp. DFWS5]|uniref:hypothetical protein n=1 Tax=Haloarchaeobius sp. DFWS5 TaxID=3446114 RepID=UPI003EBB37A8